MFQRGEGGGGVTEATHQITIWGSFGVYRLYMVYTAAGSVVLSRHEGQVKTRAVDENNSQKTNFKKVGFSTMAFTAKILSWRFRHLNIVGCLLKRRPTKGGSRAPQDPLPSSCAPASTHPPVFLFSWQQGVKISWHQLMFWLTNYKLCQLDKSESEEQE